MLPHLSTLVVLACAASFGAARARAETTLVYKLVKGARATFELTTDIDQEARRTDADKGGGKTVKENSIQIITVETTVDRVGAEGVADLSAKITRIRSAMDVPAPGQGRIEFDSDDPPVETSDVPAKRLRQFGMQMVGQGWTMQVDRQGKVSNLKPRRKQADPKAPPAQQVAGALGEDGMREITGQFFAPLSASAVDAGSEWQKKVAVRTQYGTLRTTQTLTYDGSADGGLHKLLLAEVYDPKVEAKAPIQIEMPEGSGEFWFDAQKGLAVKGSNTQTMTMKIDFGEQGSMEQKIHSKRSFRLVNSAPDQPPS